MTTFELQESDSDHHMHPFTCGSKLQSRRPRVVVGGRGVWLIDSEGKEILDGMSGLWCVNVGYGRTELVEAARQQMQELPYYNTFFQTTHIPAVSLAAKLAELTPDNLNKVFFASSGSEANDTNIRMARTYWAERGKPEKSIIISRKNSYHGSTVGSGSLSGMTAMHSQGGLPIPDIVHINQPDWWSEGGDMAPEEFAVARARELESVIIKHGENRVAAFVAEPIQGAGGVIIAPDGYWAEIQRICDDYEILLIADEVICGFGRTGNWFGSQTFKICPDIVTVAKGLSSGYQPIAASIVSDEIAHVIDQCEFSHGYTYSGHPVAAAVALENVRILEEEKVLDHVNQVAAPYLKARWTSLGDHPMVGEARIVGMMGSIALTPDKENRAPFASQTGTIGEIVRDQCFAHNLVMRHVGDRMVIAPPLIIRTEEIDILIERAVQALDDAWKQIKKEDLWR